MKEDVLKHLSKEHTANMSLLYYDFNNATDRVRLKKLSNLSDMIIPEENEECSGKFPAIANNMEGANLKMPSI